MKNIEYAEGHYCKPNGDGDYDFVCPEKGLKPGFIPYMYAFSLNGTCACGKPIVRVEKPQ